MKKIGAEVKKLGDMQITKSCVFQSAIEGNEVSLPQLPLPCIHCSATRVYFGHERRLAEGKTGLVICDLIQNL